ncbi:dihydrofolate reductase [Halorubrum sp. HHNYT27]|uniref:dihydrofolate reductase n=1 Tax=Halorubrum sp. HHNYT27 TaxID=3402275 RepID=UPI003EB947F3
MTDGSSPGGSSPVDLVIVAAVAENGVIGDEGEMPWHHPADLAHFKRLTTGHPVIVGRTTYESIAAGVGGPLPDRTNIVLTTRDLDLPEGAVAANDVEEAIALAAADADDRGVSEAYVIGGAAVYEQFLDRADRMVLTEIPGRPTGDTRFPEWDADTWREVDREVAANAETEDAEGDDAIAFVTYERTSE